MDDEMNEVDLMDEAMDEVMDKVMDEEMMKK